MVDALVVDASAWLAVLLQEEPYDLLQAHLIHYKLYAPSLIRYETANSLIMAERRGRWRVTAETRFEVLRMVYQMGIEDVPMSAWWNSAAELCHRYRLSFYDASYLAIARCLRCPVLSLDKELQKAAVAEKIQLLKH